MSYKAVWYKHIWHHGRRKLAKWWLSRFPDVKIIGVTGSYGKTNTVQAISVVLKQKYIVLSTDINLDTVYNLPITLLKLHLGVEFLVLEYGIDQVGEMDEHLSLVKSDVAVLTGISPVHTDEEHLGSVANLKREKAKLLEAVPEGGLIIANFDDDNVKEIAKNLKLKTKNLTLITYGTRPGVDYQARNVKVTTTGTEMEIKYKFKVKSNVNGQMSNVKVGLIGQHFAHQALVATIIGHLYGISDAQISQALSELQPLPGRMSFEPGPLGTWVLNDSKRSNPASAKAGLETLASLSFPGKWESSLDSGPLRPKASLHGNDKKLKKIAVLGEMGEINEQLRVREHEKVGKLLAKLATSYQPVLSNVEGLRASNGIGYFIAIGPLMQHAARAAVITGMNERQIFVVDNVRQAAEVLKKLAKAGDLIYLKGSLLRHLERILLLLRGERQVGCTVVACPFYWHCSQCQYLEFGYQYEIKS